MGWLLVWILVGVWVYRDAESRAMNGALWLIIVLLLSLIGIIIYLIVRGDHPVGGRPMYAPYGYPPYGGMPPPVPPPAPPPMTTAAPPGASAATTCGNCGAPLPAGVGFCPNCGTKL